MTPDERLLPVAEAIAEGRPVDWAGQRQAGPEHGGMLRRLQLLESVVTAHRAVLERGAAPEAALRATVASAVGPEVVPGPPTPAAAGASGPGAESPGTLRRWGSLDIRARLGEGAFGEVYRAYDASLDREVALKLMKPEARRDDPDLKRFLSEARRLARVRHPHVLVVHGVDSRDGRVGIWTDFLRGKTLEEYLAREGTIGAREAALIGVDLCRALAAVHKAGLVHRDVKPSNVMREEGGRIVLMDFGSGGDLPPGGGIVRSEHAYGTPLCMAPEQLRGEVAGAPTDVYALGVLLYRAVSGTYPFEAESYLELVEKHRRGEAVPLRDRRPDLPTEFVQVVDRALEPDPGRRFPTAGAMERALAATLGAAAPAAEVDVLVLARARARRRWLVAGGIAAAVVAGVVLMRVSRDSARRVATAPAQPRPPATAPADEPGRPVTLTASAILYRETKAGGEERLSQGARVKPGDDLFMRVESPESLYLYVLNEDAEGNVYVLFPVPGLAPSNPLPPGERHRLPGTLSGEPVNWEVTSAGGRENVLALASRTPLGDLERDLSKFTRARPGAPVRYGQLSPRAVTTLRGIGGFSESRAQPGQGQPSLAEVLQHLAGKPAAAAGDPWVWQIGLENPAP